MSNIEFKQKNITTKSGGKFLLQHPGVRNVTKINDRVKNKFGVNSEEKICDEMFKHVVVEPKMTIDDFENYSEMVEVANKAYFFVTGTPDPDELSKESDSDDQ
ncbi:hypothetical protein H1230_09260 [Paenibacillus sp. 19GGS1-52]|uniref:hypothetical protein n=1 Tax=Paenibacillus sp. 19GGS1-52 TaxID=2758563 RepID=UPI001EFA4277|nr:hypothetical protein [Paenibacillus sp. 19GGS1-52]ULO08935.1 hypothetical protein H1230_09260 [Paenibacillus sp. 19GGS1-52]